MTIYKISTFFLAASRFSPAAIEPRSSRLVMAAEKYHVMLERVFNAALVRSPTVDRGRYRVKLFIVDDDHQMVKQMTALLEDAGHRVRSCVAGE
jgi:PleD family two-component response regulator